MKTLNIGTKQVEIDALDLALLETLKVYEEKVQEQMDAAAQMDSPFEMMMAVGKSLTEFFDALFGEGFSCEAYEGKRNIRVIISDYRHILDAIAGDMSDVASDVLSMFDKPGMTPNVQGKAEIASLF